MQRNKLNSRQKPMQLLNEHVLKRKLIDNWLNKKLRLMPKKRKQHALQQSKRRKMMRLRLKRLVLQPNKKPRLMLKKQRQHASQPNKQLVKKQNVSKLLEKQPSKKLVNMQQN